MTAVSEYSGMMGMAGLLWVRDRGLFVAVDVFDDVVDGGDAADDEW